MSARASCVAVGADPLRAAASPARPWIAAQPLRISIVPGPTDAGTAQLSAPSLAAADRRSPSAASAAGQASVELLGILPLAALVALAIGQLLAAGAARELAGNAAEAGAAALLEGTDPEAAARDALPGWSRERTSIRVAGRVVEVHVRPRTVVPLLADRLEASASANAGPPS